MNSWQSAGSSLAFALGLACSACRLQEPQAPGASLIEVLRAKPAGDFMRVGQLKCPLDDETRETVAACEDQFRSSAVALDADVVVIERVARRGSQCVENCIELEASAYQRVLPWQRAVPTRDRVQVLATASLGTGTGFVVSTSGAILTAFHVVKAARTLGVWLDGGRYASARLVRSNTDVDLAVLEIDLATPSYLSLTDGASVQAGDSVWTFGFPVVDLLGVTPKFTEGSISAISGPNDTPELYQISVPIQPGNSGGPLLLPNGLVVGVITSTVAPLRFLRATGALPQGINWAVKSDLAKGLFEAPPSAPRAASKSEAIARATKAVCLIEAVRGDGLLVAPPAFGETFSPTGVASGAFDGARRGCADGDAEACLSVARSIFSECAAGGAPKCRDLRLARTLLTHACGISREIACEALRARPEK